MRSFEWPNMGADSSAVGLYCATIPWQQVLGSLHAFCRMLVLNADIFAGNAAIQ